ncbi:MAG: glycosyltransferase, partial [Magnetococcales bacterium]|nr:glycosyltransferase [Magnetococcales bacterium]
EVHLFALSRQYPSWLFPGQTQIDHSKKSFSYPNTACLDSINPLSWINTWRKIRAYKADATLFIWWHPFFAPAFGTIIRLLSWFDDTPSFLLCHNVNPHESSRLDRLLLHFAYRGASGFLVHSNQEKQMLQAWVPGRDIVVHGHPIYDQFTEEKPIDAQAAKEQWGLSGKKVVLFFGFIRPYKGLAVLLESLLLPQIIEEVHLLVAGEFYESAHTYRPALDALAKQGRLTLLDYYLPNEQVPSLFAASDVLVAPYLSASQSGVIQIARAFHLPVVATQVGGLSEMIDHGVDGWLVPPGNAQALAHGIQSCLTKLPQPGLTEKADKSGPDWKSMALAITDLMQKTTGKRC